MLDDEVVATANNNVPDGWYSTDAFTQWGLKFIDDAIGQDKPFLLYLAHNAPHFPLQATADDIAMFRGKYRAGWDTLADERLSRQIESGLIDKAWTKSDRPDVVANWGTLSEPDKERFDHLMAVYAACVWRMDQSIGTLVSGLTERGVLDDTLIMFMSDNGGCAESGPEGRSVGDPTTPDSTWFCGESWAYLQDTPFRKYKHYNHEGGIATPLIVHWPAGIAEKGGWRDQPAHLIDVMATIVEVTGAEYPAEKNGKTIQAPEGRSLLPVFAGEPIRRKELYWEHEGNAAVRQGDWKLVRLGGKGDWELYDMKSDRTESHDLATDQPDKVGELSTLWDAWADRVGAVKDGLPKKSGQGKPNRRPNKKATKRANENP
jgi:arylsulfatase